jgi:hypothetical protein
MYAGDPHAVRSWTARHGAALRSLGAAHAEFVDAVSGARGLSNAGPGASGAEDARVAAAADRLLDAGRRVAALPPVPDEPARELVARLLAELHATVEAGTADPAALRMFALRSSLTVVDLIDRLLQ